MTTAARLLDLARQEIGTCEEPAGSNAVKYNTAYYGRKVSGGGYPWCCVFVWWLFREAGCSHLFFGGRKTASCGALATWAKQQRRFVTEDYRPGDLVFLGFSGYGIEHMGVVESVRQDGALVTIEGNTGSGSDAGGGQVQRRVRKMKYVRGALRPDYEEDTVLPIPHECWDLVYRDGDLYVLESQWQAAVADYADDANYTWSVRIEDPETEETYSIPVTVTADDLSDIYTMEDRKGDTTLLFDDIELFGTLVKTHQDGLIAASTGLACRDGSWYWRSETIDDTVEGWPEYVVQLPNSITAQLSRK